jgi:hypothetical protein
MLSIVALYSSYFDVFCLNLSLAAIHEVASGTGCRLIGSNRFTFDCREAVRWRFS